MGEQGAALQGYNAALLEGLAELRARREELNGRIREEEAERGRLQARLGALSQRLARTNESLAGHLAARSDLDRSIAETEAAYGKAASAISSLKEQECQSSKGAGGRRTAQGLTIAVISVVGWLSPFTFPGFVTSVGQGLLHSADRTTAEFAFKIKLQSAFEKSKRIFPGSCLNFPLPHFF
ncbi:Sjoegren syndrome nuclear autoantigen 1 isoform X4 [Cygnus olor]|uniref:Sjoegren syndrome nuclear autoantigen 1 isoform X4 n=1 Tax=Cygnus olor TaxID=8869 RepID=UPI001ADE1702|nr:Sjoegren syndrome nuclear autoantigen 1 isoform X4 [Cygnus olor]